MPQESERTVSLPPEQSAYVDALVQSGAYASISAVVQAGLRALQAEGAGVDDDWLRDEIVPVAMAMQADPHRAISADDVFAGIRALHIGRKTDHG